jgi:hypothetical protein
MTSGIVSKEVDFLAEGMTRDVERILAGVALAPLREVMWPTFAAGELDFFFMQQQGGSETMGVGIIVTERRWCGGLSSLRR